MGGRGTFSTGNNVPLKYKTVGSICGVKVLQGTDNHHNLPEEAHSSNAYIKVDNNGAFVRYREFNADKTSHFDIDYHPEPALTGNRVSVYHIHYYVNGNRDSVGRILTKSEMDKYKKYFRGR